MYLMNLFKKKRTRPFILLMAIWSSTIMPALPSYAKMLTLNELPYLDGDINVAEMAQGYTQNQAANEIITDMTNLLSKAGSVKFSLNLNKKLPLKNSQFDWLIPWYEQTDLLLFSQHSIHNTDGRQQTNNSIGVRQFNDHNTLGVNTFFDHDLSDYHSRLGLGAEYWQNYLKLNANTYFPVSSSHSPSELSNKASHEYNTLPARGWDIQAQGWLPAYPHLGGNLKFEQYIGHDVALVGKNKHQEDPPAATIGMNWTPFTLVTFSTDHRISSGLNDTSAKVQFTWTFDKSFIEQIDPSKVGESRRLSGNHHDLINRNNNMTLNYQKKTSN